MKLDLELVRVLEELAANAWPAHVQQALGAWRLRATFGVSKRANSVYTVGPYPDHPEWHKVIDEFYSEHGIPVCYYVSDASPADLDGRLEAMGLQKVNECLTMTAPCAEVMSRIKPDGRYPCRFASLADDEWIDDFLRLQEYSPDSRRAYAYLFSAMPPNKALARIHEKGKTIGMGTIVVERGWAYLGNVVVEPSLRGQGIGSQLLRSLTGWAAANGAEHLFLQVERDNAPAVRLYEKLGFVPVSRYHYRVR